MKNNKLIPKRRFKEFENNEAWEQRKLGEVAQITMGQSPNSENYTDNPNDHILVQGNADMKHGRVLPRVWTTQVTKQAEKNDLILSVRAPVGDVGKTDYDVVLGRGVAGMKGNEFIFQLLTGMKENGYWRNLSTGSTFESINSNDIKEAYVLIPNNEEQTKIGEFFKELDNLITLHQRKLKKLEELKLAYLSEMFPKGGKKYPKLRFFGFTDPWEQRKFGELYKVSSGYAFKYQDYCDDGIGLINGESIQHGKIDGSNINYLPEDFLNQYSNFVLKENDIVLGLNRPITNGNLKISKIPREFNDSLLYQRAGKINYMVNMDSNFSFILLSQEILKHTLKEAVGSDQPFISTSKLDNWKMMIPKEEEEQVKIGKFFSNLDHLITLHQRKLEKLEDTKKAYLSEMFV